MIQSLLFYIFYLLSCNFAWSFTFPGVAATPEREKQVKTNLYKVYYKELEELEMQIKNQNGSSNLVKRLSEKIKERNQQFLQAVNHEPLPEADLGGGVGWISKAQAQSIYDSMSTHPVVKESAVSKYDKEHYNIGFCFGRAAYVHLELLRHGVHPKSMIKVFAIGSFPLPRARWDFHVVTLVRGPKNQWLAIDTVTAKTVSPIALWMKNVEKLDENPSHPTVRFYMSDAIKLLPGEGGYSSDNLYLPYFHHYFEDLAKWFDQHPVLPQDRFNSGKSSKL